MLPLLVACASGEERSAERTIAVATAGALARPVAAALVGFARRERLDATRESAGSVELVRRLTDLGRVPDVLMLADAELFPELVVPAHATWHVVFARDRLTLAYRPGSRFEAALLARPWHRAASAEGVELGRSDPDLDPAGYRALLAGELAERHLGEAGLARRLLARAPRRNVRPKSADLVALVQAGELDAAWVYASVARSAGLRTVPLPDAVHLGSPADSAFYATASVRVAGARRGELREVRGRPIRFALTVPTAAPHRAAGARFAAYLLSADGARVLRAAGLDVDARPQLVGTGAPAEVVRAVAVAGGGDGR